MRVTVTGKLQPGVTSKDVILAIIGAIGTAGGNGHVIEFAGEAIASLSMEVRGAAPIYALALINDFMTHLAPWRLPFRRACLSATWPSKAVRGLE